MRAPHSLLRVALPAILASGAAAQQAKDSAGEPQIRHCRVEPGPGALIQGSADGGGMNGWGWDGFGQNGAVLTWHMEGSTPDMGPEQRAALIGALQAWADWANIFFIEVPVANQHSSIDFHFLTGDHSAVEPHEAGDPDCPFNNASGGVLAHAGFPPGASGTCGGGSEESYSGNVHFDEAETWSTVVNPGDPGLDLLAVATHEVGHALGLTHSSAPDIMKPTFGYGEPFAGLTFNDIVNILSGYAGGGGVVTSLEQSGVWVDSDGTFPWKGTPSSPFPLVSLGVGGVPPASVGVELHIDAGTYDEGSLVISDSMVLVAENGSAILR